MNYLFWILLNLFCLSEAHAADGKINFYVYHLNEADTVVLSDTKKNSHLFRSRDSESVFPIDPRLLQLIDQIEDHFGVRQVEIISGYRSQVFNRELKETGHHVAGESLHIKGMAADIHLDEITEEAVRDYALSLQQGGVGFYPSLNMVHVDVGPVRTWGEPAPRKPWVGEKNAEVPVTLTVKPDRTLTKQLDQMTIVEATHASPLRREIILQFFEKTDWKDMRQFPLDALGCEGRDPTAGRAPTQIISLKSWNDGLKTLPYGKYRLKVSACEQPARQQYSNEFYFKKR